MNLLLSFIIVYCVLFVYSTQQLSSHFQFRLSHPRFASMRLLRRSATEAHTSKPNHGGRSCIQNIGQYEMLMNPLLAFTIVCVCLCSSISTPQRLLHLLQLQLLVQLLLHLAPNHHGRESTPQISCVGASRSASLSTSTKQSK